MRSVADKLHKLVVVVVAALAVMVAFPGSFSALRQAWYWALGDKAHAYLAMAVLASLLVLSRVGKRRAAA